MKAVSCERPPPPQSEKKMMRAKPLPGKAAAVLCTVCFLVGLLLSSWMCGGHVSRSPAVAVVDRALAVARYDCELLKRKLGEDVPTDTMMGEVAKTHQAIKSLEKKISSLEMELAVARTGGGGRGRRTSAGGGSSSSSSSLGLKKAFVVVGINTAFSSKKRRDSLRETWVPRGSKLKRLEEEKGIVVRFVIGHSATPGGVLDRAIDVEDAETTDFLRLDHVEGYHELSRKTRAYFSTAASMWDADFSVKVDDDVYVNLEFANTDVCLSRSFFSTYKACERKSMIMDDSSCQD